MQLEPASAVWTSGLTVQQSRKLQRVENRAIAAFSDKREDPKISAQRLKLEPLDALKFAQQTVEGAFLQSKTTYEVSLALLDQTVKWRMFMIS